MKATRSLLRTALVIWASASSVPMSMQAQAPPPSVAHVRLWIADPHGSDTLRVSFKSEGRHAVAHELGGSAPGYQFASYIDIPVGRGTFEVFATQEKRLLGSVPVDLQSGKYVTALLGDPVKAGGSPQVMVVDDGDQNNGAGSAQVTVRNFVGDLKGIRVVIGESLDARFISGAGFLVMSGIKPALYQVHTSGTTSDGKSFEWTNEMDLKQNHRQTLLIYPDPYGRIRPRWIVDGESIADPVQN